MDGVKRSMNEKGLTEEDINDCDRNFLEGAGKPL